MDYSKQVKCIELERAAEVEEEQNRLEKLNLAEAEDRLLALTSLKIFNIKSGWFGRYYVTFEKASPQETIGTGLRPSSIARLYPTQGTSVSVRKKQKFADLESVAECVVVNCSKQYVNVSFEEAEANKFLFVDDSNEDQTRTWHLATVGSITTFKRRLEAAKLLSNSHSWMKSDQADMFSVILDKNMAKLSQCDEVKMDAASTLGLNDSQKKAVRFCIRNFPVCCLHGPPGTGKTTTLAAVIKLLTSLGHRLLVTAPSNIAVDNILARCGNQLRSCVRLGHPARMDSALWKFGIDGRADKTSIADIQKETEIIMKLLNHRDLSRCNSKALRARLTDALKGREPTKRAVANVARAELRQLRKDLRAREGDVASQVISDSQVVFVTCNSSMSHLFKKFREPDAWLFDYAIVDEASKCIELESMMPCMAAKRLILAGDHKQLQATVVSREAEKLGFGESLMSGLLENPSFPRFLLTEQYRMNEKIMQWSSDLFYQAKLVANGSVRDHVLSKEINPLIWVDTSGIEEFEEDPVKDTDTDKSRSNVMEGRLLVKYFETIIVPIMKDTPDLTVGVVSPYARQVKLLSSLLDQHQLGRNTRVATVDGFQGQECDCILLSLVRNNEQGTVGFLNDPPRLNVAVTRARKHIAVFGSSVSTESCETLASLFAYVENLGYVDSALNYLSMSEIEDLARDECV